MKDTRNKANRWGDIQKINVPSRPSAGGTMSKPDDYRDSTRERVGKPKAKPVEDAKESPAGTVRAARNKQIMDKAGIAETMRTLSNTPGCK